MLDYKKMIVLGVVAFTVLAGLTKIRMAKLPIRNSVSCVESCSSFPKTNDFSIADILSVKFR